MRETAATVMSPTGSSPRFERRLAILPFQYRGPAEHAYLADAMTDDLVDELARVRGLVVLSSGATRGFKDQRDPRALRKDLGADAVVDGSMQTDGKKIRISARLDDASTGTQIWNDRFEGGLEDVFALQDSMRRRIAESLRVGLTTAARRGDAPPEAVDCYLRARVRLRAVNYIGPEGALPLLERALELAPDFAPAVAAHATARVRAWFLLGADQGADAEQEARAAVARALSLAGDLAETHHAAGSLALNDGNVPLALQELNAALAIAPTYVDSLESLGLLECEIGRTTDGKAKLRAALDLDPTIVSAPGELARQALLDGDEETFRRMTEELTAKHAQLPVPVLQLVLRAAAWKRDFARLREIVASFPPTGAAALTMLGLYARTCTGETTPEEAADMLEAYAKRAASPRFLSLVQQGMAEAFAVAGALDLAEEALRRAADARLVDVRWLDRCPALDPIRSRPGFAEARSRVAKRIATGQ
jgi:serine/threonine-protein kinase